MPPLIAMGRLGLYLKSGLGEKQFSFIHVRDLCEALQAAAERGRPLDPSDPNSGVYFVAEEREQVVGQLGVTREWSDWRNGFFWWIQSVYVRREARRRGVFRSLFQHVVDAARSDPDVIGIRLYVDGHNDAGQATYAKLGLAKTDYWLLEKHPLDEPSEPRA